MKKNPRIISTAFVCAAIAFAAVAGVMYYRSLMISFDMTLGHFDPGIDVTAFIILACASFVLAVVSGFTLSGKSTVAADRRYSRASMVAFVALGAVILAKSIIALPEAFSNIAAASSAIERGIGKEQIIGLATPIFGIVSAVYFVISTGEKKTEKARAYMSFAAIIWALLFTLSVYFDSSRTINSPIKAILLCLSVANMLFITEDARFFIGTQKAPAFRAICTICAALGITFALPHLICSVCAALDKGSSSLFTSPNGIYGVLSFDLLNSIIALLIPVCAAVRLITSDSYLAAASARKHEKKAASPFGETPKAVDEPAPEAGKADDKDDAKADDKDDAKADDKDDAKADDKDDAKADDKDSAKADAKDDVKDDAKAVEEEAVPDKADADDGKSDADAAEKSGVEAAVEEAAKSASANDASGEADEAAETAESVADKIAAQFAAETAAGIEPEPSVPDVPSDD